MIETPNYLHEARIKLTNAEMSLKYGEGMMDNPLRDVGRWGDIKDVVGTNQWNFGLSICIRSLKADLGLPTG